ncbi:hypothetical protein Lfu02_04290 [Longispora fulva]|uniref:Uncharacterized protein n=1 Tax=Longispora fulva TaxID=619741 RepID=A0A8J7GMC5_9ACTN|nr:hypothetical protein [Longispora fulva]MBG6135704.1 hypothetical protein [Longispora fulva]GIG56057.1 hypothetical protein Lfu02_04290 [Longispora fulva]
MRIRFTADGPEPLSVTFEPSGMEYEIASGAYVDVEWPAGDSTVNGLSAEVEHSSYGLRIVNHSDAIARAWDSHGEELMILG